jgi:hypothetical protein
MLIQILELSNEWYTCTGSLSNNIVAINQNSFYEQVSLQTNYSHHFRLHYPQNQLHRKNRGLILTFFKLVKTNQSLFKYLLNDQSQWYQIMKADNTASPLTQSDIAISVVAGRSFLRSLTNQGGLHMTAQHAKPPKAARPGTAGAAQKSNWPGPPRWQRQPGPAGPVRPGPAGRAEGPRRPGPPAMDPGGWRPQGGGRDATDAWRCPGPRWEAAAGRGRSPCGSQCAWVWCKAIKCKENLWLFYAY